MNKKALAVLEYDKIISMLRECAGSEMAKTRIGMFRPSSDPYKIQERLAETTEAVTVITAKGALPVGQLYDIENALHLARKGGSLTMKQLLQVLYNMKVTGEIVSFLRSDLPELPILDGVRYWCRSRGSRTASTAASYRKMRWRTAHRRSSRISAEASCGRTKQSAIG